jgi:hypothetical protein
VTKHGRGACFAAKALDSLLIVYVFATKDLNGNFIADVHSPRAVDSAHAPLAQERSQFVFAI